jgi:tetratricopeptide (TPR) repeat protein
MSDWANSGAESADAAALRAAKELLSKGDRAAGMQLLADVAARAGDAEELDYERDRELFVRLLTADEFVHYVQWIDQTGESGRYKQVTWAPSVHAEALWLLGFLCAEAGRCADAIQHLERARRLLPRSAQIRVELAFCHGMLGDHVTALAIYQAIQDVGAFVPARQRAVALRGMGAQLTELGRLDEALRAYSDSLRYERSDLAVVEMRYIHGLLAGAPPTSLKVTRPPEQYMVCYKCGSAFRDGFCGARDGIVFYLCEECERRSRRKPWQIWRRRGPALMRLHTLPDRPGSESN